MYYYGYQNYAAGVIGILVLAVALTALLVVLVLPKEKDGHLPSVFQMLYDLFSPKTLVMEKLLQILYVFLTCLAVLYGIVVFFSGFFSGFQNLALGLVILAVGAGPLVRYGLLSLTYRFLAAAAQPVSDKRLVEAFGTMAEGCALLMRILFAAEILCMLTFLILMAGGGLG